ncbi:MAG: hypothetical protein AB7C97_12970 [Oscillospiraceae bacterium]
MIRRFYIIVMKKNVILTASCFLVCIGLICFSKNVLLRSTPASLPQQNSEYVILAVNDLGMHCYQPDYSGFLILPPGNNLKVQVFRNDGESAELINSGIEVSYQIIDNTYSAGKINFWEYAADYGYDVEPDIGITGNGLSGVMELSDDGKYYEATAIPVTPYNDGSAELNPYQLAVIRITDVNTGRELAKIDDVVVPVSDEMECGICHGESDTDLNILQVHDELSGTRLADDLALGKRYKCSDCHQDNILGMPGEPDVLPLSQAIHGFHADKMAESDIEPECYSCHPGPVTKCYRGVMSNEVSCVNSECHGNMYNVAGTQAEGRQAWLQEPDCGVCHGDLYAVNTDTLYRDSYLINNENYEMNGIILCESCHNGPHAEWKSTNPTDNLLPKRLLGYPSFINRCTVCHEDTGVIHQKLPD